VRRPVKWRKAQGLFRLTLTYSNQKPFASFVQKKQGFLYHPTAGPGSKTKLAPPDRMMKV
jgi:hypothetical protein